MAKDNEFLNGVRVDQFIKGNNDQIKDTVGGISSVLQTSMNAVLTIQKQQLSTIKSMDKSVASIDKHVTTLVKLQENMLKVLAKQTGSKGDKYIKDILKSTKYKPAARETKETKRRTSTTRKSSRDLDKEKKDQNKYLSQKTGLDKSSVKTAVKASSFKKEDTGTETVIQLSLISSQIATMMDDQREHNKKTTNWFKWIRTAFLIVKALDFAGKIKDYLEKKFPWMEKTFTGIGDKFSSFGDKIMGGFKGLGENLMDLGKFIGDKFSRMFIGFMVALNKMPFIKGKLSGDIKKRKNNAGLAKKQSAKLSRRISALTPKQQKAYIKYRKKNGVSANTIADEELFDQYIDAAEIEEADSITSYGTKPRSISTTGMPSIADVFSDNYDPSNPSGDRPPSDDAYYKAKDSINLKGIRSDVWHNFTGMVNEYHSLKPNRRVQINSGYRDVEYQRKLYKQYRKDLAAGKHPAPVANPGKSMHNYGYALDINSREANEMADLGLLDKWNFHRPVKKGKKGWETWHIEPKGLEYAKIQSGVGMSSDSPEVTEADALTPMPISSAGLSDTNLPQGSIGRKPQNNSPISVVLMPQDIENLAAAFGKQMKDNIKMPTNRPAPANLGSPRGNL